MISRISGKMSGSSSRRKIRSPSASMSFAALPRHSAMPCSIMSRWVAAPAAASSSMRAVRPTSASPISRWRQRSATKLRIE